MGRLSGMRMTIPGGAMSALPVPVEVIEQRTVGPTLGKEAIDASAQAAVIGVALTSIFIVVVYRLLGGLAVVALAGYALISYAALVALIGLIGWVVFKQKLDLAAMIGIGFIVVGVLIVNLFSKAVGH